MNRCGVPIGRQVSCVGMCRKHRQGRSRIWRIVVCRIGGSAKSCCGSVRKCTHVWVCSPHSPIGSINAFPLVVGRVARPPMRFVLPPVCGECVFEPGLAMGAASTLHQHVQSFAVRVWVDGFAVAALAPAVKGHMSSVSTPRTHHAVEVTDHELPVHHVGFEAQLFEFACRVSPFHQVFEHVFLAERGEPRIPCCRLP